MCPDGVCRGGRTCFFPFLTHMARLENLDVRSWWGSLRAMSYFLSRANQPRSSVRSSCLVRLFGDHTQRGDLFSVFQFLLLVSNAELSVRLPFLSLFAHLSSSLVSSLRFPQHPRACMRKSRTFPAGGGPAARLRHGDGRGELVVCTAVAVVL